MDYLALNHEPTQETLDKLRQHCSQVSLRLHRWEPPELVLWLDGTAEQEAQAKQLKEKLDVLSV